MTCSSIPLTQRPPSDTRGCSELFRELDEDDDGGISRKDFRMAFPRLGPKFPHKIVDTLYDYFDVSKDESPPWLATCACVSVACFTERDP